MRNYLFIKISWFIAVILITGCNFEPKQIKFNHPFNPISGMVSVNEQPHRNELCLNGKWQFMPVFEKEISNFVKPDKFEWDSIPIKIPSPWNVNSFPRKVPTNMKKNEGKIEGGDFLSFPSYPERWEDAHIGWMRKEFTLPEEFKNKELELHFEAIAGYTKVYVNGQLAAENLDIFFPTIVNVTDLLHEGSNEIVVGVAKASLTNDPGKYGRRNYVAGSFWGKRIAGIWQDVYLFAYPKVYISDLFVKPDVKNNKLEIELEINNTTEEPVTASAGGLVSKWENLADTGVIEAPVQKGKLVGYTTAFKFCTPVPVPAKGKTKILLSKEINDELDLWTPENPNLYGVVIELELNECGEISDKKYQRFGWRQFTIEGKQLLLNGEPIVLKGDSWHFMGIPQMSRRYAWGWYKMLKDINANAVRLHAQPFPRFYLDVADEMGICVLDETGIWSSDGGPKMDSDDYWVYCREHVKKLVLRDRNHPSVFGWSVCNETLPVAIHVFHAPESIVQKQIDEINEWIAITRKHDPTRDWISGDGETMRPTDLPTIIGHYGGKGGMKHWSSQDLPWGIGEQGMGYFGTPKQVSAFNGNRAYESQLGRMEGLGIEAYDLIKTQLELNASYSSIFNVIWYGLQPLELGLSDLSRLSNPEDGIHFGEYIEGIPGVQPERLGPYSTTLNPGYDPNLPLYKSWPLYDAVKAAFAEPIQDFTIKYKEMVDVDPIDESPEEIYFIGKESNLKQKLDEIGVPFNESVHGTKNTLIIIDGASPVYDKNTKTIINKTLKAGGTVLVYGVDKNTLTELNQLLPYTLEITNRKATSFIKNKPDAIISGLNNKDFYYSELTKDPVMKYGLKGKMVDKSEILLEACNTDWTVWNYCPEFLKTGSVVRSEREYKPIGNAMIKTSHDNGNIYVTSIDLLSLKGSGLKILKMILSNIGVVFSNIDYSAIKPLNADHKLEKALFCGTFDGSNMNLEEMANKDYIEDKNIKPKIDEKSGGKMWDVLEVEMNEAFNFKNVVLTEYVENSAAYLSFWVFSPRSLVNLLAEPDMPQLDMIAGADDGFVLYLNGKEIYRDIIPSGLNKEEHVIEKLPLEKGWNHFLIKSTQLGGEWQFSAYFKSDKKEFLRQLGSSLEN